MDQLHDLTSALCEPSLSMLIELWGVLIILLRRLSFRPDPRDFDPRDLTLIRPQEVSIFPVRPEVALPTIPRYRGKGQRRRKSASIRAAYLVLSLSKGQHER